jgi:hypothetical protein
MEAGPPFRRPKAGRTIEELDGGAMGTEMAIRRYLVVANETLGGSHLLEIVRARLRAGPCHFQILVPATPAHDRATWIEDEARATALTRLRSGLERFRELGADVDGAVGDHRPLDAISDAFRDDGPFDEIIISTLPPRRSRWLKLDLPHRVEATFRVPVTHVVGQPERARTQP